MKRITVMAVLVLLAAPAMAAAQEEAIDQAFARVEAAGIPVAMLESLQAEGKARGVPMDVLADAMQRRADALIRAREAMRAGGPDVGDAELAAGADAIQAGVGEAVLAALAQNTAGSNQRVAATAALGVLVELGHVPYEALARVEEALARGPESLGALHGEAMQARTRRGPPPSALSRAPLGVPMQGSAAGRPTPPRGRPGGGL
jgi:hypothetical protein